MQEYEVNLEFFKKADHEYAVLGDTITYVITMTNEDRVSFDNVVIYDILGPSLAFKEGSVKINQIAVPDANVFSGIEVGTINPREIKEVTFQATVIQVQQGYVENKAIAHFNIRLLTGKVCDIQVESQVWCTKLFKADLEVLKKTDKEQVNLGDEITYSVAINNVGDLVAVGILFTDTLAMQTELIEGSVKVNGISVNGVDLAKGILIGKIDPKPSEGTKIEYRVKVIGSHCSGLLINKANVTFRYILPDGTSGQLVGEPAAVTTCTHITLNTFKQLSLSTYLGIPCSAPDMETLNIISGVIDNKSCHVIDTPKVTSEEGQTLTGHKLIVHGSLELAVEYTALEESQSVHSPRYTVPFSTFVVLPLDYKIGSKLDITGVIEDMYYQMIDIRNFFVNATFLINVKVLG